MNETEQLLARIAELEKEVEALKLLNEQQLIDQRRMYDHYKALVKDSREMAALALGQYPYNRYTH